MYVIVETAMEFLQDCMGFIIEFPKITAGPPEGSSNVQSEDIFVL